MVRINVGKRWIGTDEPTYFVADIAANHDGDLARAKHLIALAAEAGADAVKFQNFQAKDIVSAEGFEALGGQLSHQASWAKPVFEVYKGASVPWEWTPELEQASAAAGVEYFTTPYDLDVIDVVDPHVAQYKIGSGDITWTEMLERVAAKGKPVMLATGASEIGEVQHAVDVLRATGVPIVLMQCNTNYTASLENFRFIHLNVLKMYAAMFPDVLLGLSDHTPGHATVLGAVALGARVVEKHFTDDTGRDGPDHVFSMDPASWRDMVDRTRELEAALGSADKHVEPNERDTAVVQRRCLRLARDVPAGTVLTRELIDVLRPAPAGAIAPYDLDRVIGMALTEDAALGAHLRWGMLKDG
jgi:N-acetylneuraminate synthase